MLRRCRPLLGTYVEIAADCAGAIEAGFAAMELVHELMSAHRADSDVGQINRRAHFVPVEVHAWTAMVIERALFWAKASAGAFDPVRAGKAAIEQGMLPLHAGQPLPEADNWTGLQLEGRTVRLLKPGCIDLGGIAKGFAVDRAVCAMRASGIAWGLVNAGGDLSVFGPEAWRIEVVHPITRRPAVDVDLCNQALATSAVHADGEANHLPKGAGWISASVRASSAMDADALTKLIWSLGHEATDALSAAGANAFVIRADGAVEAIEHRADAA